MLAVVQVAVVIVLIYVGTQVGDLSSDVDDIKSEQSGLTNNDPDTQEVLSNNTGNNTLIFSDDFDYFNLTIWKHEITLGGGGNWEFQYYDNNRSNMQLCKRWCALYQTNIFNR